VPALRAEPAGAFAWVPLLLFAEAHATNLHTRDGRMTLVGIMAGFGW
jgi:hypothetical protein